MKNELNRKVYLGGAMAAFSAALLAGMIGEPAAAANISGNIRSRGTVQCEEAVIDAADLQNIHAYVSEKKNAAAGVLLQLGTKFRQQPEGVVYDRNPDSGQGDVDASQLSWPVITQAVADSQKVPEGLSVLNPENAMHIEGVEEYTDYYVTAVADNISRGKAAWADGVLLLGNGADNDKAYQAGIRDGGSNEVPDLFYPLFSVKEAAVEIKHAHTGGPAASEGRSGCYQNSAHTERQVFVCGVTMYKTDAIKYPDGTWHGGMYTCQYHGGMYESPGTCPHEDIVESTTWSHNIVCGLSDAVYARLRIQGTDTDYTDGAIKLEAVLEEGSEFGRLSWRSEDRLVWTDDNGNTLGTGSELTVQTPGNYHCSINVNNTDISNRTVSGEVKISGLILKISGLILKN